MLCDMRYLNNPLNIRYSKRNNFQGQLGRDNGFCTFASLGYGFRAAAVIIMRSYRRRGVRTYSEIINNWAPLSDNNPTDKYVDFVCGKMNVLPFDVPSSQSDFARLLHYMNIFETGSAAADPSTILYYLKFFGIHPVK